MENVVCNKSGTPWISKGWKKSFGVKSSGVKSSGIKSLEDCKSSRFDSVLTLSRVHTYLL